MIAVLGFLNGQNSFLLIWEVKKFGMWDIGRDLLLLVFLDGNNAMKKEQNIRMTKFR